MIVYETVVVAFSMFSALPMPRVEWNARNMKFSLCSQSFFIKIRVTIYFSENIL